MDSDEGLNRRAEKRALWVPTGVGVFWSAISAVDVLETSGVKGLTLQARSGVASGVIIPTRVAKPFRGSRGVDFLSGLSGDLINEKTVGLQREVSERERETVSNNEPEEGQERKEGQGEARGGKRERKGKKLFPD